MSSIVSFPTLCALNAPISFPHIFPVTGVETMRFVEIKLLMATEKEMLLQIVMLCLSCFFSLAQGAVAGSQSTNGNVFNQMFLIKLNESNVSYF